MMLTTSTRCRVRDARRSLFESLETRSLLAITPLGGVIEVDDPSLDRSNATGAYLAYWPHVAMDSDGTFIISWTEDEADESGESEHALSYARAFQGDGTPIGGYAINEIITSFRPPQPPAPEALGRYYSQSGVGLGEATGSSNTPHARVWEQRFSDEEYELFSAGLVIQYGANAKVLYGFDDPDTFDEVETVGYLDPTIAMDESGNLYVAYGRYSDDGGSIVIEGLSPSLTPLWDPVSINVSLYDNEPMHLACDADGDAILYYRQTAVRISKDGELGTPYAVPWGADVAMDDGGDAFFTWEGFHNGMPAIFAARQPLGQSLQTPHVVAVGEFGDFLYSPQIAADGAGGYVVVWLFNDGDPTEVLVRGYMQDSDTPLGAATVVGDHINYATVAMSEDGKFVVVWQTDDYKEILAQRFTIAPKVTKVTIDQPSGNDGPYDVPAGANQLRTVPVGNADLVRITFDQPVAVAVGDLELAVIDKDGNPGTIHASAVSWNAVDNAATWTFPIDAAKAYKVTATLASGASGVRSGDAHLDGEWLNPDYLGHSVAESFPSGDGTPGGDFVFQYTLLPGDGNLDNKVTAADASLVFDNWGGISRTFIEGDYNSDGTNSGADYSIWSDNFGIDWYTTYIRPDAPPTGPRAILAPVNARREPSAEREPGVTARIVEIVDGASDRARRPAREAAFEDFEVRSISRFSLAEL